MPDFSSFRINSQGQLVYPETETSLGIPDPAVTSAQQVPQIQAIGIIDGFNLGDGLGIYTTVQTTSRTLSGFKSLVAGSGVTLTSNDQTITINSNFTNVLAQLSFDTVGGAASIFKQKIAGDVQLRSLTGSGLIGVQENGDTVVISATAVTSVGLNASNDFVVANSPVTSSGLIGLSLSDTGVSAGTYTYPEITVDAKGRITAISTQAEENVTVQAGSGITVTPGPNYTVGLTSTGVAYGAYTAPSLLIDETGRITAAFSNTIPDPVTAANLGAGAGQVFASVSNQLLSFRSITGSGPISVTQTSDTITISSPDSGTVTQIDATGANGITVSGGPISVSGTLTVSLNNTTVTPGSYTAPTISVDATGRITSASSNTLGETNTASNLSGGYGLFAQKSGVDLQFKSLAAGSGISLSSTANTVVVSGGAKTTATGLTAIGTNQAGALGLTADLNEVTSSAVGAGVSINAAAGSEVFIANFSGNAIAVYPMSGATINALAANAPYMLADQTSVTLRVLSATKVYT